MKKGQKVKFYNGFHATTAYAYADENGYLSPRQVKRLKKKLCIDGCTCSDALGARGGNNPNYTIERDLDSGFKSYTIVDLGLKDE